jgi:hypothetical protein
MFMEVAAGPAWQKSDAMPGRSEPLLKRTRRYSLKATPMPGALR